MYIVQCSLCVTRLEAPSLPGAPLLVYQGGAPEVVAEGLERGRGRLSRGSRGCVAVGHDMNEQVHVIFLSVKH